MSGNISLMAALILYRAHDWFFNPSLKPILQESSVWFQLGRVTLKYSDSLPHFRLGEDAAKIAEWKPVIYEDLSTWITAFIAETDHLQFNVSPKVFVSVIRSIWVAESSDMMKCLDARNESWVLALAALANAWKTFQFSPAPALECFRLARCTITTSLRVQYLYWEHDYTQKPILSDIRAAFSPQLGQSLIQAAANARSILVESTPELLGGTEPEESPPFERIAELLDVLGEKLCTEFEPTIGEVRLGGTTKQYKDWKQLKDYFVAEVDALEELVST
ncbi:hypothetical protein B0H13DRAFT_2318159 [Mycena leptocephala]|nr:hypothetical protein B0H13DRAFT_2318159 [Mycena leptocephala]